MKRSNVFMRSLKMIQVFFPHPVHDGCPPLHGDALEGGEHGEHDVVEAGDPLVRARPLLQADRLVVPLTQTM